MEKPKPKTTSRAESISAMAFKKAKENYRKMLPWLFNFLLVSVCVFAIGVVARWTLILTVPVVILPFLFATHISYLQILNKREADNRSFWFLFKAYFSPYGLGSYRVIRSILFSFLFSMLLTSVFAFIFFYAALSIGSGAMRDSLISLAKALENGDSKIVASIMKEPNIVLLTDVTAFVEFMGFSLCFAYFVQKNSVFVQFKTVLRGADPRSLYNIYYGARKSDQCRGYLRDYLACVWPLFILAVLLFALGSYVGYLIISIPSVSDFLERSRYFLKSDLLGIGGLSFMLLGLIPFLPYFFQVIVLVFKKYSKAFADYSVEYAKMTLEKLKTEERMTKEEMDNIEKTIKKAEEMNSKRAEEDEDDHQD